MTEKLLTVEELIKELGKLPKNSVVSVEYNKWLHNHPVGKIQVTLSINDAKKLVMWNDYERLFSLLLWSIKRRWDTLLQRNKDKSKRNRYL